MKKRILLVDDKPDNLQPIEAKLKTSGYEVITALDGEEGLRLAKAENPDLIILDIVLPKIDGWRVCQKLKKDELYKRIPIIMLSALIDEDYEKQAVELGDAYIGKPLDFEKLLAAVKRLLKDV